MNRTASHPPPRDSGDSLGSLALRAARAGVAAITLARARGLGVDFKTGMHDLVTNADRASERAIISTIVETRPDDEILGEEGGSRPGRSGVRWLVDPLDGTANFYYGRTDHAVSVGVEAGGRLVAGAIIRAADGSWAMAEGGTVTFGRDGYYPRPADRRPRPTDPTIPANPGLPARRSASAPASASASTSPTALTGITPVDLTTTAARALICFGLPYDKEARRTALSLIGSIVPLVRGVRIVGSAAGDLLAVARGEADAFVGCGLAEWDTAAGQAIVAAAGGAVRTVHAPAFDIVCAGAPLVIDELMASDALGPR